jgi:hypothetical protein
MEEVPEEAPKFLVALRPRFERASWIFMVVNG